MANGQDGHERAQALRKWKDLTAAEREEELFLTLYDVSLAVAQVAYNQRPSVWAARIAGLVAWSIPLIMLAVLVAK